MSGPREGESAAAFAAAPSLGARAAASVRPGARARVASASEMVSTFGSEYEVLLGGRNSAPSGVEPKWSLGCYMVSERGGLRILAIHPTGAVSDWNAQHPEREVKVGDLLVEVGLDTRPDGAGVRGNGEALREALYKGGRPAGMRFRAGEGHPQKE